MTIFVNKHKYCSLYMYSFNSIQFNYLNPKPATKEVRKIGRLCHRIHTGSGGNKYRFHFGEAFRVRVG
jgi:hypothetical protein